jgi:hypothetical protein
MYPDTTICPKCGDENAYFNGATYECPDCGREWESSLTTDFEETDDDRLERFYREQDLSRVGSAVDADSIRRLFSPSYQFDKWHALYRESGPEEDYYDAVVDALLDTGRYTDVAEISPAEKLSDVRRSELFHAALRGYIESRDELPAFPRPEDWASYVDGPLEIMREVCPSNGVDVAQFLPLATDPDDFTVLFHRRISAFHGRLMSGSGWHFQDSTLDSVERLFTAIVTGEDHPGDDLSAAIGHLVTSEHPAELSAIQSYREDFSTGIINQKIAKIRSRDRSTGEVVVEVVEPYLSELLD